MSRRPTGQDSASSEERDGVVDPVMCIAGVSYSVSDDTAVGMIPLLACELPPAESVIDRHARA
ncbi:MAG: hypothetical protein H7288_09985 [Kineosporiaceae bacterium]|nr:hypothetical protein [Aeromicrobium sp.]